MWPPSRVAGVTARSRFTGEPDFKFPRVERESVSFETSAANESDFTSSAVRQTPLTAIESPSLDPSVTVRASITMRASSPRFSISRTRPSSSMIPVNIRENFGLRIADFSMQRTQEPRDQENQETDDRNCERKDRYPERFIPKTKSNQPHFLPFRGRCSSFAQTLSQLVERSNRSRSHHQQRPKANRRG